MRIPSASALGALLLRSGLSGANLAAIASMAHEVLVDFFRTRPSLAAEILVEVLGLSRPPCTQARVASIDLTEIKPAEYRADVVVMLLDGDFTSIS